MSTGADATKHKDLLAAYKRRATELLSSKDFKALDVKECHFVLIEYYL